MTEKKKTVYTVYRRTARGAEAITTYKDEQKAKACAAISADRFVKKESLSAFMAKIVSR
jgi:hypothetical protein